MRDVLNKLIEESDSGAISAQVMLVSGYQFNGAIKKCKTGEDTYEALAAMPLETRRNLGLVTVATGLVLLWIAREPIMELLDLAEAQEDYDIPEEAAHAGDVSEPVDPTGNAAAMPSGDEHEQ